ncbi:proline-rich receptor-like protein kinase PERK2 [Hevea brasiliensis]|uniref:proline-rich receptor-like protein kinase PERK2 n=1 Tax=Hevea brasiliensis TaxID=3981 RepID=UPI0025EA1933|nr:proline-rich receptor-like protein kinase PERK2 [Hevea brasiliensis]
MGSCFSKPITEADRRTNTTDDRSELPAPVLPHQSTGINPIKSSSSSDKENQIHAPAQLSHQSPVIDPIESSSSSDEEENQSHASASENAQRYEMKQYGFRQLAEATDFFSNNCLLGEGGFGQVFQATIDGEVVAIKKLKKIKLEDKLEESEYLSCVSHPNIVKMIGYCSNGADKLLILEFVPNNTLTHHLHEENNILGWSTRMKIAIHSAKGLQYLHERCKIIHRDIKADNILLDNNFEPKVADFSLSNFLPNTGNVSHITSTLRGTNVYVDPEFGDIQRVSEKSDVYSFGVVLLELITGKKPSDKQGNTIINWAKERIGQVLDNHKYSDLVDSRLQGAYNKEEMGRMICCAAASIYKPSRSRPIIKQIIKVLQRRMSPQKIMDEKDIFTLQGRATTSLESVISIERTRTTAPIIFTYRELADATNYFSNHNLLGDGGLGLVYKGKLSNGEVVAIKKLREWKSDFEAEIQIIHRTSHRNLVKLIGYCFEEANMLLVSEFVHNKSLRSHLHGRNKKTMDWSIRMKIAIGVAKGLAYLHEACTPKILHRNINMDNILLDYDFEPKISDFGLVKELPYFSTRISFDTLGSAAYFAPEYVGDGKFTGKFTDKSDVFSFGVVLLGLITGKPPVVKEVGINILSSMQVVPQLKQALDTHNYKDIIDVKLQAYDTNEIIRMIYSAAACVYKPAMYRPKMSQIVEILQGKLALESIWLNSDNSFLKNGAPYLPF